MLYFRFSRLRQRARECGRSAEDDHSSMENILLREVYLKNKSFEVLTQSSIRIRSPTGDDLTVVYTQYFF